MQITNVAVLALRVLLVLAFLLLIVFQVMSIPGQFAYMAEQNPEQAHLRWPLTAFGVIELLCVQVVIVSTWKLLDMVRNDRIFSEASMKWVNAIVGAIVVAWVLLVILFLFVGFNAGDPGPIMVLSLPVVGGAILAMLMIVMRALLGQATTLRTDMDEVL